MDDFRNHIWEDTSFYSDEAKRRTQVIDSFTSSDDKLRAVVGTAASGVLSSIKTGSRALKLGESIGRIGRTAVSTSKVREYVGEQRMQESVTKSAIKARLDEVSMRRFCRECGGSTFCWHGKRKATCKECGGSAFCCHGKPKARCKECGGTAFCCHGKYKARCRECDY